MIQKNRALLAGCTLLATLAMLTGCERVRTITNQIKEAKIQASAGTADFNADQIIELKGADYEAFTAQKDRLVVVDFYANWCGPCHQLSPVLEKAAQAHPGVVFLGKVNVDKEGPLTARQRVSSIPDVRIFKDGKQIDQFVGFPGESEVLQKIAELSKDITPVAPVAAVTPREPTVQPMEKDWMPNGMEKR